VVGVITYTAVSKYVLHKADENLRSIMLSHRSFHDYIQRVMHPTYYKARDEGKIAADFYAPEILSSSYVARVMHGFFNEERQKEGLPLVYYKLAANNPRNPVNKADEKESALIKLFNSNRELKDITEVTTIDGQKYLIYAKPFLETNQACIRCHGKRKDAPIGLQKIYSSQGGFNESTGVIRAIESIRLPITDDISAALVATTFSISAVLVLIVLYLFNLRLRRKVQQSTEALVISEENYRQFATLTSDYVHKCTRRGEAPFRIQWIGGALSTIAGYSTQEMYERGCWLSIVHPDDKEATAAALAGLAVGDIKEITFRIITRDDNIRWICDKCRCKQGESGDELILYGAATDITDKKHAEQLLAFTRVTVNAVSDAIFWINPAGRIVDVNEAACRNLGYTREELLQMEVPEVDPNITPGFMPKQFDELRRDKTIRFESTHRTKDGRTFPVEVVTSHIRFGDDEYNCAIARDISERKQMEEALNASNKFNQQVISCAREGIVVYGPDLRYQIWNPFMEEMTGIPASNVLGKHPLEVFPFLKDVGVIERLQGALAGEQTDAAEFPFSSSGRSGWSIDSCVSLRNEAGEIIGVISTVQDVTARKNAQIQLRQSEEKFRSIVESSPSAMYFYQLDSEENLILTGANPAADRIIGVPHNSLLGKTLEEAFPNLKDTNVPVMYRSVAKGEIENQSFEISYDDGGVKGTFEVHVYRTGPNQIAVDFIEISERKRNEEERIALEKQLLHAQKLESLGVLAGGIAHDFNNLLTSIVGNTDLALMRLNTESPVRDNLHQVELAATRAADLAKQMLAYSGKGKFIIESIDLNRLVEEMTKMLEVSISKKCVLRFNFAEGLPTVDGDATQFRQVVMNLVINASEAIGTKSGVIAISTGCMQCDRKYLSSAWLNEQISEGLYVWLEIADTGCGMDKETASKIFDPFFTTKFTGRGLGMAAVLGIVRGHKGAIKVYSEPGRGTTFKVLLPAVDMPKELFNGNSGNDTEWKGSGTVLLVDDEETVIGIGSEMLKELGFHVLTAMDGREALDVFKNNQDQICCVILDLTMPHLDGEQTFRELRLIQPDIKVVMSSGYNEQEVTQRFMGKGLAGFIQKPYKFSTLRNVIRGIL
jgi:PAS domain S-box-containing protein